MASPKSHSYRILLYDTMSKKRVDATNKAILSKIPDTVIPIDDFTMKEAVSCLAAEIERWTRSQGNCTCYIFQLLTNYSTLT